MGVPLLACLREDETLVLCCSDARMCVSVMCMWVCGQSEREAEADTHAPVLRDQQPQMESFSCENFHFIMCLEEKGEVAKNPTKSRKCSGSGFGSAQVLRSRQKCCSTDLHFSLCDLVCLC